jgi:hypothetical protein
VLVQGIGVPILLVAVIILFYQTQNLQMQLSAEQSELATLQVQVQNQNVQQQDLNERVEQEHSLTMYQMAGTFTLLTCLLTAFHMAQHLAQFQQPVVQRKIIAILWMSPIYSVTSFLSLIFPVADGYLSVIRDFYEAYVIYTFLSFLIAVIGRGDRETAVTVLAQENDHLEPPARCLRNCYHPPPPPASSSSSDDPTNNEDDDNDQQQHRAMASAVLMECQILAMQFVLVRPVTSIAYFVVDSLYPNETDYQTQDPYAYFSSPGFFIAMVTNISVFFAFHGLLKFYHLVHEELKWCQPFSKFMAIKGIVFLTFWQGLLISIIVNVHYNGGGNGSSQLSTTTTTTTKGGPTTITLTTMAPSWTPPESVLNHYNHPNTASPVALTPTSSSSYNTTTPTAGDNHPGNNHNDGGGAFRYLFDANDPPDDDTTTASERAAQIQNFLICLEMLFFSIAHWCVFPAEEWDPQYRPKTNYAKPGLGLKDFAKDVSFIVASASSNVRNRTRRRIYRKANQIEDELDDPLAVVTTNDSFTNADNSITESNEEDYEDGDDEEYENEIAPVVELQSNHIGNDAPNQLFTPQDTLKTLDADGGGSDDTDEMDDII